MGGANVERTADTEAPTWAVPGVRVVMLDGIRYWVYPRRGPHCFRVSATIIGDGWAQDAVDVHMRLHHQMWR